MSFPAFSLRLAASLLLSLPLIGNAETTDGQNLPSTDTRCFEEGRLLAAAKRDGFRVQAEAQSETPISPGARVYFVADDEHHEFGVIASIEIGPGTPMSQCNWGKGSEVRIDPVSEAVRNPAIEPVNKLSKLCRPLDEYLRRLEGSYLEIPYRRFNLNPEFDSLVTRSLRSGSWSLLLVDKRDAVEVACFFSWGRNFRIPGESPDARTASLR